MTIFVKLGSQNRPKINRKSISETKMGAQGDQAKPKAPKLKPNAGQSLPKVVPSHPKTTKVVPNGAQSGAKMEQNGVKNGVRIQNDFREDILLKILIFSGFFKPGPSKKHGKTCAF